MKLLLAMKKRKTINFDLSTNELKRHFNSTAEAYSQIKTFMLNNSFEHRQYSGYVSKEIMDDFAKAISLIKSQTREVKIEDTRVKYLQANIIKRLCLLFIP